MTYVIRDLERCRAASWIIREKATRRVICEVFSLRVVAALNTTKYEAVPILAYLGEINGRSP